eukprot:CAMPEP_0174936264 /NCGR_PEP_ID=MMETSP1355-20121228/56843_1 /TAXON_ID=464990 /ORGANISM="Hemiselmis tepida, Strain CCMP443" /LENGTH=87 /DNA_ID=CAMNT_0016183031 /DNA_START=236 /DNA_END=496 /DNA_ORIENTATION=+
MALSRALSGALDGVLMEMLTWILLFLVPPRRADASAASPFSWLLSWLFSEAPLPVRPAACFACLSTVCFITSSYEPGLGTKPRGVAI